MIFRDIKKDYEDKYNAELNKTGVLWQSKIIKMS